MKNHCPLCMPFTSVFPPRAGLGEWALFPGRRLRLKGLSHVTCLSAHSLRWSRAVPCSEPKPGLAPVGCSFEGPLPPEHGEQWVYRDNCFSSPLFYGRITQKFRGEVADDSGEHRLMCSRATVPYTTLGHQLQHQTTLGPPW